jgi:hypothetical protein
MEKYYTLIIKNKIFPSFNYNFLLLFFLFIRKLLSFSIQLYSIYQLMKINKIIYFFEKFFKI